MAFRTDDELKNMIFVYRGQPFVRASAILSGSAKTKSLDYSYTATPFVIPSTFDEAVTPAVAKAIDPGLEYFITSISSSVVSAVAFDPKLAIYTPFNANLKSMSYSWQGQPFVLTASVGADTPSLDYAYKATPLVVPTAAPTILSITISAPTVTSASAAAPSLLPSIAIPASTAASATAFSPQIVSGIFLSSSAAQATAYDMILEESLFISPTISYAYAYDPVNILNIDIPSSSVAQSTAHDLALLGSIFITSSLAQATAYDPVFIQEVFLSSSISPATAYAPQVGPVVTFDLTASLATAIDPLLVYNIVTDTPGVGVATAISASFNLISTLALSSSNVAPSTAHDISFEPSVFLDTAHAAAAAYPQDLLLSISLSGSNVAVATAYDMLLQENISISIDPSFAFVTVHDLSLIPTVELPVAGVASARAIDPTIGFQPQEIVLGVASATATAPTTSLVQNISIGLGFEVVTSGTLGDAINRGEPFEPWTTAGDLINRGEPFSANRNVVVTIQYQGVASAIAIPPDIEIGAPSEIIRLPRLRLGQSGTKRSQRDQQTEESIVWAKLIRVNDNTPGIKAEGFTRVRNGTVTSFRVIAEGSPAARVRKAWEDIKIVVARVK